MRTKFLQTLSSSHPFKAALADGFSPKEIKRDLIAILDPYLRDKELLQRAAVGPLAAEAICTGKLSSNPSWLSIFESVLSIREYAITKDKTAAAAIFASFQDQVIEAQRKFAMHLIFEVPKVGLEPEEQAYETFRNIGEVLETSVQPLIRELYCLAQLAKGVAVDLSKAKKDDFGVIVGRLDDLMPIQNLVRPEPWDVSLSQWRNIAQHHSYRIINGDIEATYGKSLPPKQIKLSCAALLSVALEIGMRLGALRCSRVLALINAGREIIDLLPTDEDGFYGRLTTLGASFATQGFELVSFSDEDGCVNAVFTDSAPQLGEYRQIHCSQFILPLASSFPDRSVTVELQSEVLNEKWVFAVDAQKLKQILELKEPFHGLADAIDWPNTRRALRPD